MQSNMPHYHLRNLHSHQSLLLLCYYVNILGFYENHTSLNSSVQPTVLLLPVTKLAYFCKHAGLPDSLGDWHGEYTCNNDDDWG